MAASNDGRYLAYGSDAALWTVRADSPTVSTPVRVASVGTVWDIAWSPDRSRLAYTEAENGEEFCVWMVALPAGNPVKIRCGVRQPSWLPDMQALVVAVSGGGALERIEAKANGAVLGAYAGTTGGTTPAISRLGRWIAYVSFRPHPGWASSLWPAACRSRRRCPTFRTGCPGRPVPIAFSRMGSP